MVQKSLRTPLWNIKMAPKQSEKSIFASKPDVLELAILRYFEFAVIREVSRKYHGFVLVSSTGAMD